MKTTHCCRCFITAGKWKSALQTAHLFLDKRRVALAPAVHCRFFRAETHDFGKACLFLW